MTGNWALRDEAHHTILRLTGEDSQVNQRDHLITRYGYAGVPRHQAEKEMEWLLSTGCVKGGDVIARTEKGDRCLEELTAKNWRLWETRPDPKVEIKKLIEQESLEPRELRRRVKELYEQLGSPNGESFDQLVDWVASQLAGLQPSGWEEDPIARFIREEGV